MAFTLLSLGMIHTLTQNVVYALPAVICKVRSNGAIEGSQDGTNFVAITLTNNEAELACAFIRTTAATALVTVKKA